MEQSVRENTLDFIKKEQNCDESLLSEEILVDYFGDLYSSNPANFCFEIGDKKTIKLVRDHINKQIQEKGAKYLRRFRKKSHTKKSKGSGTTIGQVNYDVISENDMLNDDMNLAECSLSVELIAKLKAYLLRNFKVDDSIVQSINQNTVEVEQTIHGISAKVFCILCDTNPKKKMKPKKVFYKNDATGSKHWVLSNYGQHLTNVHKLIKKRE